MCYEHVGGTVKFLQLGIKIMKVLNQTAVYDGMLKYENYRKLRVKVKQWFLEDTHECKDKQDRHTNHNDKIGDNDYERKNNVNMRSIVRKSFQMQKIVAMMIVIITTRHMSISMKY